MGRDSGIGLGLLAACGLLYWQTGAIPTPPFVPIGPAFYPRIVLVFLAALAVWLILEDVLTRAPRPGSPPKPASRPNYRLVLICFVVFGGYVVGLSLLGYLLSTFLFVLGLGWIMGPRLPREVITLVAVAAGTTLTTYLVFEKYLHVFLPRGLLF
ncbi:MAG TPA: tripartite tricarboxylate transporter TctB family protein [Candidatus Methylomirabilis sp.]|nr:tripartite tricarboxylate transporter TctB family protein [Candidatus Methylomirabilis sp.]